MDPLNLLIQGGLVGIVAGYSVLLLRHFLKFTQERDKAFQAVISGLVGEFSTRSKTSEDLLRALASEIRAARETWRCGYNGAGRMESADRT